MPSCRRPSLGWELHGVGDRAARSIDQVELAGTASTSARVCADDPVLVGDEAHTDGRVVVVERALQGCAPGVATRFEDDEPDPADEYLLERASLARARSERQIVDAITAARANSVSWQRVGEPLRTSARAAQQRNGEVVETG
jgi:hypothetical protein